MSGAKKGTDHRCAKTNEADKTDKASDQTDKAGGRAAVDNGTSTRAAVEIIAAGKAEAEKKLADSSSAAVKDKATNLAERAAAEKAAESEAKSSAAAVRAVVEVRAVDEQQEEAERAAVMEMAEANRAEKAEGVVHAACNTCSMQWMQADVA